VNAAKGNFDGPRQDYQIDANDQLVTSKDYRSVVVAYRNGGPVMLTDVAKIVDGVENSTQAGRGMDQTPAVILNVQRQPGANTISVVNSIKLLLPQLQEQSSRGNRRQDYDRPDDADPGVVDDVEFELLLTVLPGRDGHLLFLRRSLRDDYSERGGSLSLIGTFAARYLLGYSLDNLSLMALTISTGLVVDDAIVMVENISAVISKRAKTPMQAALKGAEQNRLHDSFLLTVSLIAVADSGCCSWATWSAAVPRVCRYSGGQNYCCGCGFVDADGR